MQQRADVQPAVSEPATASHVRGCPMSVGVKVDALALMLDGAGAGVFRFAHGNVRVLESGADGNFGSTTPAMEQYAARPEWAEVAEAILELEAWADWYDSDHGASCPMACGDLACQAEAAVGWMAHPQFEYLEAAALLRDGWRPRKGSKR